MKKCSSCKIEKEKKCFPDSVYQTFDGKYRKCLDCCSSVKKKTTKDPVLKYREDLLAGRTIGKQSRREIQARWRSKNKSYDSNYSKLHRSECNEKSMRRRAKKLKLTPFLSKSDNKKIKQKYILAKFLNDATGVYHHVDHIVSLNDGGAHHWANLRVVTKKVNLLKGAKSLYDDGLMYSDLCAYA